MAKARGELTGTALGLFHLVPMAPDYVCEASDKKTNLARMDRELFRSLWAAGVWVLLVGVSFTTPLTANRALRLAVRWSLGGGVASRRSEGECAQRNDVGRTAQATP